MKHLFTTAAVLFSMTAFAQVGINNTSPKATLDITAKTSGTKPEGLIIPQLSGNNIHTATAAGVYGANQTGLIVYASSADSNPTGPTANITTAGYYYFDGTNWQKISTGNTVSTSLASGNILVGNASNVATAVSPTGDVTISNTGATSIAANAVTTSKIANNAVTIAKLPTGATATTYLRGDGTWVTPTDTNTTYTAGSGLTLTGTSFSANDATATTKGIIQLAGDLAGPVAAPTIASNAVTSAKIADGAVTASKLNQMSATSGQVLGWNGTAWAPTANGISTTLNNGNIYVGNASNVATAVSPTGDVTITNAGVTSVDKLKGKTLSATAPTNGQVLKYNTTTSAWEPAADIDTNTTYTGSASINLNGTSFERTALSGDVTASANSNTTTIAANAVTSSKIADGTIANGDLDAGVGGIYKGNGALSGNTIVAQGGSTLAFTSTATNGFSVDGTTLSVDAANNRVGIGTSSPSTTLDINGNMRIATASSSSSSSNVATLVRDNTTGEIKIASSSTGNTANMTYIKYNLSNVNKDWIANFNTNIPSSQYTVVIVGSTFNQQALSSAVGGSYNPLNVAAYDSSGTWRIYADYNGGDTANNGTWTIYCLVINNSVIKTLPDVNADLGGTNSGSAPLPSGL